MLAMGLCLELAAKRAPISARLQTRVILHVQLPFVKSRELYAVAPADCIQGKFAWRLSYGVADTLGLVALATIPLLP